MSCQPAVDACDPVSLRPCVPADLPFLQRLYASTRAAEVQASGWPAAAAEAFLLQQFQLQHAHYHQHFSTGEFLLIEQDGQPVGRLYLCESPGHLQLVDIALLPALQRRGLGRWLMARVLERADRAGLSVGLHVDPANPARHWYLRLGFLPVAGDGLYLKMLRPAGSTC